MKSTEKEAVDQEKHKTLKAIGRTALAIGGTVLSYGLLRGSLDAISWGVQQDQSYHQVLVQATRNATNYLSTQLKSGNATVTEAVRHLLNLNSSTLLNAPSNLTNATAARAVDCAKFWPSDCNIHYTSLSNFINYIQDRNASVSTVQQILSSHGMSQIVQLTAQPQISPGFLAEIGGALGVLVGTVLGVVSGFFIVTEVLDIKNSRTKGEHKPKNSSD